MTTQYYMYGPLMHTHAPGTRSRCSAIHMSYTHKDFRGGLEQHDSVYSTQHRLSGVLNRRLTTNPKDFGVLKIIESVLLRNPRPPKASTCLGIGDGTFMLRFATSLP